MDASLANGMLMDTGGDGGLQPSANPNRQRPRVTRACDNCKARKMRCTGKQPCAHCIKRGKTCEYKATYTRGAAPAIETVPPAEQVRYFDAINSHATNPPHGNMSSQRSPSGIPSEQSLDSQGSRGLDPQGGSEFPERPRKTQRLHEMSGRIGPSLPAEENPAATPSERDDTIVNPFDYKDDPATGESLYERTEQKMIRRYKLQKTPVYMYGDAPFPDIDNSFFVLPTPELARAMVRRYFSEGSALTRILHAPTVEIWTTELLSSFGNISRGTQNNGQRAVVLMVFASSHESMFGGSERTDTDLSFYYFHAAENQLRNETGEVCLATIQARLLQCHYLLSRSRVNHACSVLATMVNFIFILNLHRKPRPPESDDLVYAECAKRTFWQAFVVDKYLASSLGRPAMLRDEDSDQDLPLLVNDADLSPTTLMTANITDHSETKASIYHIKLCIIMHKITQKLPNIRKPSIDQRFTVADSIMEEAQAWRDEIAHFIDIDLDLAPLSTLYQSQIIGLRIAYQEMLVLLFRPFLLDDLDRHQYANNDKLDLSQKSKMKVSQCLNAAWAITDIIDSVNKRPDKFRTSWFFHYCGYQAIVALYVYVIKNLHAPNWKPYFEAASRCQDQIKVCEAKESFSQKSSGVLDELRMEAIAHIRKSGSYAPVSSVARGAEQVAERQSHAQSSAAEKTPVGNLLSSTSFFGGNWSEVGFDQRAPGGGILSSLGNVDGTRRAAAGSSVIDHINTWGFSSLNGY